MRRVHRVVASGVLCVLIPGCALAEERQDSRLQPKIPSRSLTIYPPALSPSEGIEDPESVASDSQSVRQLALQLSDQQRPVRWEAARRLAVLGPQAAPATPALIELLKSDEGHDRLVAVDALANIGPQAKAAVPLLLRALDNWNMDVRARAAVALGRDSDASSPDVIPALTMALSDPEPQVCASGRRRWVI